MLVPNIFFWFLDQELISLCYPSCSSSCFSFRWSDHFKKCLRLHRFKSDQDEIWQDCSSSKYASIEEVRFSN